jgi:hypothetical protein
MKTEKSKTLRKPSAWGKITGVLTKRTAQTQGKRGAARISKNNETREKRVCSENNEIKISRNLKVRYGFSRR